ncbi:MAG: hypothetical protein Unbinned3987contig1001_23 [Prokaryotic dsDNA virus sp.]|jgi:uncharacterized protein YdaU (DUF1376 family)|nr:MAG: hypothetical protein Unbinned3987contig1001_23 [Prokaryotic dsDNA virus sp.]|tara:strand:- start:2985 stop:3752 length:768 start_codon:yes stop_codon:yes gene_type:complete
MKQTYFPHDSNARNDIKIIRLRKKLGLEGYGIYFCLIEMLFADKNMLCIDDYETLAFALQCDPKKLESVINDFDLFTITENCFYSERLNETIGEIIKKSVKARENAEKRWNKANVMQSQSNSNAIKLNKSKTKEIKKDDILLRLEAFQKQVFNFKDIDLEDQKAFIDYWTEPNKSGSKMRFEMEKTWDLSRRLKRWTNSSFNKPKEKKFKDYYDAFFMKNLPPEQQVEYTKHLKSLGWESTYSPNAGQIWKKKKL